jgi:hypothetical protein
MFHHLNRRVPRRNACDMDTLKEALIYPTLSECSHRDDPDFPLSWFKRHFEYRFGIDVYEKSPKESGYEIYDPDDSEWDCLLIRLEDLSDVGLDALHEYLGVEFPELIYDHDADYKQREYRFYEQHYRFIYEEFRDTVSLPRRYLERMYEHPHTRHFYSDEEIAGFYEKWG